MSRYRSVVMAAAAGLAMMSQAHALAVYGVTDSNQLISFDSATPGVIMSTVAITGAGQVRGIDFRPANGLLYAFSGNNNLYTLNLTTGVATLVAPVSVSVTNNNVGFDFNPTIDRIRITNPDDQNLAVNPANGVAAVQGTLNYASGADPRVVGSAYTNSFVGASTTTLYDIDAASNSLVTQVAATGMLSLVGALGVNTSADVGFDIFFFGNQAFASLTPQGGGNTFAGFYSINLASGAATLIGSIGSGIAIRDIAIAQVPEPETLALLGLGLIGLTLCSRRKRF